MPFEQQNRLDRCSCAPIGNGERAGGAGRAGGRERAAGGAQRVGGPDGRGASGRGAGAAAKVGRCDKPLKTGIVHGKSHSGIDRLRRALNWRI